MEQEADYKKVSSSIYFIVAFGLFLISFTSGIVLMVLVLVFALLIREVSPASLTLVPFVCNEAVSAPLGS